MPTRLQFDQTHSITVAEDIGEVESAIRTAEPGAAPLARFTHKDKVVWVNVALIRAFAETRSGAASF